MIFSFPIASANYDNIQRAVDRLDAGTNLRAVVSIPPYYLTYSSSTIPVGTTSFYGSCEKVLWRVDIDCRATIPRKGWNHTVSVCRDEREHLAADDD